MENENRPKYWGSLEEYEQTPEFKERLGKEFASPPEETSFTEMERRDFLKVMGAGMLLATTACYRRPVEKIIPYVNRPEEVVPGVPNWYTSVCGECSGGCGLLVKTREGRPIKLEGNASHPLNKGGLCARGQASLLNLYDPDRLRNPLSADQGRTKDISWDELDQAVKAKLSEIKQKKGKVALLTGSLNSPATLALIQDFLSEFPGAVHVAYEGVVPEEVALAQEQSYGEKVTPRYRFDLAKMIVSFGADFLGTWLSPVEFAKGFAKARRPESGAPARFVSFESVLSLTGTNADAHFAVKPGDELAIALGLAHELAVNQKVSRYAGNAAVTEALSPYDASVVEKQTGIPAEKLKAVADQLWKNKGNSLVVGGPLKAKNSLALEVAVNLLNSILENDGITVDASTASYQAQSSYEDLKKLLADMKQGRIDALFIDRSNPAYTLPLTLGFAEAVKKVPLVVSLADRMEETAAFAHYVAPDCHYLESWNDSNPQKGLYTIGQPAIRPLYQTRSLQDSLIAWAGLPDKSWYDYLRNHWQQKILTGGSFETLWEETLKKGFFDTMEGKRDSTSGGGRSFSTAALTSVKEAKGPSDDLLLGIYPSLALFDGRSANNGWLQELPDPLSKITWDNYLSVAPKLAKQMDLEEGDVVHIQGQGVQAEIPVHIQPMLHEKAVMAALGYGRPRVGRVGTQVGINVNHFQLTDAALVEWTGHPISITKTGRKEKLAATQTHTSIEGRPIIQEMTFTEFEKKSGKDSGGEEHKGGEEGPLPSMWSGHQYNGPYRWGMAIDMNACIGCNACMVGCQSENNIPVVGKKQVSLGREMHWIRIDRYYSGDVDQPKVNYQPMLCQHCENAPCETVCPVLATVHSDEGLNMQIYNRCVGTRYCSNNCPYKVRRFNFFNFYKFYKEPLNLVLNPDLTTRTRGVMEKCTFCIQRIQESKDKAKAQNRIVKDGEFKTACQQTCPADAITFGNINDPESLVSKMKKSPRGYHVLEDLNVKPQVTYLQKIRDTETA